MERRAAQRARDRANAARWNLEIAIFLFAIVIIVVILSFQGIGLEIVASVGFLGLSMVWVVGWRQGKQLYKRFYSEELSAGEITYVCAWCGEVLEYKRGQGQSIISHGICHECIEENFPQLKGAVGQKKGRRT